METSSEGMTERQLIEGRVRQAARALVIESTLAKTTADLSNSGLEIARMQSGIDPDAVDPASDDYRMGAVDALSAAHNAMSEMLIYPDLAERLKSVNTSRALTILIANKQPQKDIVASLGLEEAEAYDEINFLHRTGLVEYAISEDSSPSVWRVSPFGEQTFMKLLTQLSETVPKKELLRAIGRFLESKKTE